MDVGWWRISEEVCEGSNTPYRVERRGEEWSGVEWSGKYSVKSKKIGSSPE
jgi:hypothetical protein